MGLARLRISLKDTPALTVNRVSVGNHHLVYFLCASKRIEYAKGRSPIVYIGTTSKGVARMARTAAHNAERALNLRGVNSFDVRVATCGRRQGIQSWRKLERAFILGFKELYGEVPYYNTQGKWFKVNDEFRYFARSRIDQILQDIARTGLAKDRVVKE